MKHITISLLAVLISISTMAQNNNSPEAKAATLLKKMTLEEKVGQMTQVTMLYLPKAGGLMKMVVWIR